MRATLYAVLAVSATWCAARAAAEQPAGAVPETTLPEGTVEDSSDARAASTPAAVPAYIEPPRRTPLWWIQPRETPLDLWLSGEQADHPYRERRRARGLLWIPRLVLFVPQSLLVVATEPLRLVLYLQDRYALVERARRFFFNDAGTFGVYPTFFFETGFGPSVGARLVHKDLFGRREALTIRGGFGGLDRQVAEMTLDSGRRLPGVRFELVAGYEETDRRRFYTVGNADEIDPEGLRVRLDARGDDVAVESRYVVTEVGASLAAEVTLAPHVTLAVRERIRRRDFDGGDEPETDPPWITGVYEAQSLVGFVGQTDLYHELRLRIDGTRSISVVPTNGDLPTHGARLDLWGGYQDGLDHPFRFGRAGFDAQAWVHLFGRDRVLRFRLRGASVIGEQARIPLVDLPTLGGWQFLRGYPRERFRDRVTALSQVEYRFPLFYLTSAYVFVDAGRVYRRLADLGDRDLRVGYGGGVVAFSRRAFLAAFQVGSSIDKGVNVYLNLTTSDALGRVD